jgi:hypothetical protein
MLPNHRNSGKQVFISIIFFFPAPGKHVLPQMLLTKVEGKTEADGPTLEQHYSYPGKAMCCG